MTPGFNEKHNWTIRIWHWLFFLLIACSITTVTLATYVFRTGKNVSVVQDELQKNGIIIDNSAARDVSHAFNDRCWILHTWLGYGIALLVLARILLEISLPADEKLTDRIKSAMKFSPISRAEEKDTRYYLVIKWIYVLFYALILTMALTGIGLALEDVPLFRTARSTIKSIHAFIQYPVYAFILIHIAGAIRADMQRYPGLISSMINGKPSSRTE